MESIILKCFFFLSSFPEHSFSIYSASTIAASSIAAALSGLHWHLRTGRDLRYLLDTLTDLTGVEQVRLLYILFGKASVWYDQRACGKDETTRK